MDDFSGVRSVDILHSLGLTEQMVREHVIRPEHTDVAKLRVELHELGDGGKDPSAPPPPSLLYRLNTRKLARDLNALLSDCVSGYSMKLRQRGWTLFDHQWNWAKLPNDGDIHWTPGVKMHVASVSKLITAMAMTKLLHSRNISPDARISPYLPREWKQGPGVDRITFRQLLTHNSGLVVADAPGASDFWFMKNTIAMGAVGEPGYLNINYGLCRILITTIDQPLIRLLTPGLSDDFWDLTTIGYYAHYVNENILAPAGVTSTLKYTGTNALGYAKPPKVPGWSTGNLSTWSGAAGWHLSVDDLLNVMAAFRRGGNIVDAASAQLMLDRQFGLDFMKDTPLGRIYAKGGYWSSDEGHVQLSYAFFLPKDMELAVLVNSPFCPHRNLMLEMRDAILANIEINRFVIAIGAVGGLAALRLFTRRAR